MEKTKIKNGFYWIRYRFIWIIGKHVDGTWFFCGNGKGFSDEYVDEIGDYIGSEWDDPRYKKTNYTIFDVSNSLPDYETPHKFIQLASDISMAYIKMDKNSLKGITTAFNDLQSTFLKEFGGNDR